MNLVPIGRLYRDGLIDAFQARVMLDSLCEEHGYESRLTNRRFQMFLYRWGVMGGSYEDSREGLRWMIQAERALWHLRPSAVICSASVELSFRPALRLRRLIRES